VWLRRHPTIESALRDYGTGEWEGGDPDCNHQMMPLFSDKSTIKGKGNHKAKDQGIPYKGHKCGKCGATRIDKQIGLEQTPQDYIDKMVEVCREIRRVLRHDGTFWLNIGDSYVSSTFLGNNQGSSGALGNSMEYRTALHKKGTTRPLPMGLKQKDMMGIPWRLAMALQADGWYLRQDIIWHKPNPMPESVTDRCTKAHEYIFMLTKSPQYYYDATAIREPLKPSEYQAGLKQAMKAGYDGKIDYADWYFNKRNGKDWANKAATGDARTYGQSRKQNPDLVEQKPSLMHPDGGANKRDVWSITVKPFKDSHFATFPPELPMYCIKAGSSEKGACPKCGAPWERLQSRIGPDGTEVVTKASAHTAKKPDGTALMGNNNEHSATPLLRTSAGGIAKKGIVQKETVGWAPTCDCGIEETVPCVVYDPFGGSGTTAVVANQLGRDAIITELNPEYCKMAEERIHSTDPLFVEIEIEKPADLSEFIG
jgi:DNA modification methylase